MNKKHEAQHLYITGCRTQREIAEIIGVSERTIHSWIHQYAWDKLRLAAFTAPATIADNICSQIVELQNAIARKEPGGRYPTLAEAEIMRKLIVSLEKVKQTPSLSQNMQMLETFRNYVRPLDKDFARQLARYTEKFLAAKSVNGFAPYQAEYGVEPVAPVSPYYDEVQEPEGSGAGTEGSPDHQPCADISHCSHPDGGCTYPKCLHPERYAPKADPITYYSVSPITHLSSAMALGHMPDPVENTEESGNFPATPQYKIAEKMNFQAPQESPAKVSSPNYAAVIPETPDPQAASSLIAHAPQLASLRGTKQPRATQLSTTPGTFIHNEDPGSPAERNGSIPATPQSEIAENEEKLRPKIDSYLPGSANHTPPHAQDELSSPGLEQAA